MQPYQSTNFLDISYNKIRNINVLSKLSKLKILALEQNIISNISPLENLKNLQKLYLGLNKIQDISCLKEMVQLVKLSMSDNAIEDISAIQHLTQLKVIDISSNRSSNDITNNGDIKHLLKLQEIYLNDVQISDLSLIFTPQFENILVLHLGINNISNLSPLAQLKTLKTLWLQNNKINDISPLKHLSQLIDLNLELNQVVDLTPLKDILSLNILQLDYNKVCDVSCLHKHFEKLVLDENFIVKEQQKPEYGLQFEPTKENILLSNRMKQHFLQNEILNKMRKRSQQTLIKFKNLTQIVQVLTSMAFQNHLQFAQTAANTLASNIYGFYE
ncbi:leucine-rich_repeat domain-containing protein [Hexamita inflata]|uniref:Leucine-rich_repeat domain-containing protein n=1 Tax=Hexamita inflata TaxID=28002 RepID=A0ABP1GJF2_9EUKA